MLEPWSALHPVTALFRGGPLQRSGCAAVLLLEGERYGVKANGRVESIACEAPWVEVGDGGGSAQAIGLPVRGFRHAASGVGG